MLNSQKINQINNNNNVSLYIQNIFNNIKEYKSISLFGTAIKIENEEERKAIFNKLEIKSKEYKEWIEKDGFEKWAIIKIKSKHYKYIDNSISHVPIYGKIEKGSNKLLKLDR